MSTHTDVTRYLDPQMFAATPVKNMQSRTDVEQPRVEEHDQLRNRKNVKISANRWELKIPISQSLGIPKDDIQSLGIPKDWDIVANPKTGLVPKDWEFSK
jgi:hypothetical protein